MPSTVADLGEHGLIARIRARMPTASRAGVIIGIGDDAAVVAPDRGALTVVTTDSLVEGTHFDRAFCGAGDVGHKALAVNLSDLAAMGATPRHALLSLVLPPTLALADLDTLVEALAALAARHRIALVGGNITATTGPLVVDLTALGSVKPRRTLTRAGARPGDVVYLSGAVGAAAAGLASLRDSGSGAPPPSPDLEACRRRYLRPEPRVRLGTALGRNRAARAAMDLSDGLADAVHQMAAASGAGIRLDAESLPIDPGARAWFEGAGLDPVGAALAGGEDYELVFTTPPRFRGRLRHVRGEIGDLPITAVGVVTAERAVVLRRQGRDEPLPAGFEHFRG